MSNDEKNEIDESKLSKKELHKKRAFEYLIGHQKFMMEKQEVPELCIKDSKLKNAGKGLFTNIDIPKNQVVCFYPVKLIQDLEFCDIFYKDGNGEPFTPEKTQENKELVFGGDYNLNMYPFRLITDNFIPPNKCYLAHLPNDRAYHPDKTYKPQLNNCEFEGLNLVSKRDIKAGEELFVTYGKDYWYNDDEIKKISRHNKIKKCIK